MSNIIIFYIFILLYFFPFSVGQKMLFQSLFFLCAHLKRTPILYTIATPIIGRKKEKNCYLFSFCICLVDPLFNLLLRIIALLTWKEKRKNYEKPKRNTEKRRGAQTRYRVLYDFTHTHTKKWRETEEGVYEAVVKYRKGLHRVLMDKAKSREQENPLNSWLYNTLF